MAAPVCRKHLSSPHKAEALKSLKQNATHQGPPKEETGRQAQELCDRAKRAAVLCDATGFLAMTRVYKAERIRSQWAGCLGRAWRAGEGRQIEGCRFSAHQTAVRQYAAWEAPSGPPSRKTASGHPQIHPLALPVAAGNRTLIKGPLSSPWAWRVRQTPH